MTAKRFIVDDAGTLIDMHTRDTFDYVSDVCDLLNEQHETIQRLKQNIDELLSINVEEELLEENKQLKQEMWYLGTAHADEINKIEDEFNEEILKLEKENKQLKIALKDKENLISICEKKFKELGYLITCDDDGYVIE